MFHWNVYVDANFTEVTYLTVVSLILLPDVLAKAYGLDEMSTGLCFLPIGFGALLGSPIGGNLADIVSRKIKSPAGAIVVACEGLILMIPTTVVSF